MRKTDKIILIDPNGPNGLQEWEQMDYKNLVSGTPVQRGHLYHEIQEQGYMVGVWDCTAFTDQMMPYSVDEYMLLLAGDVAMVMPDETEVKINAGDAFVIPKGLKCQWKQNGFVHKIFMILDSPIDDAQNASLNRISVPDFDLGKSGTTLVKTQTEFLNGRGHNTGRCSTVRSYATAQNEMPRKFTYLCLRGHLDTERWRKRT